MGRYLKNPEIRHGVNAVTLPIVSNSNIVTSTVDNPTSGAFRFNSDNNRLEFFYNGSWNQVAKVGSVSIVVDDINNIVGNTIDGVHTAFFMSQIETDPNTIAVFVGGVYQQPNSNYTINGTNIITFTSAPPADGSQVIVVHNLNSTNVTG